MASINFMGPNSLPLISAAAVTAALAQRPAATVEGAAALTPASHSASQIIEAKVENVSAKTPGYELTVASGNQRLVVHSDIPLPVGTRLTLQVPVTSEANSTAANTPATSTQSANAQTANTQAASAVVSSTLTTATSTGANASAGNIPAATQAVMTNPQSTQSPAPSSAASSASQTTAPAATPATPIKTDAAAPIIAIKVLSIVLPAAADSSPKTSHLLQQFMAARVPLLSNQLAPVAAASTSTYQKPNTAMALANSLAPSALQAASQVKTNSAQIAAPVLTLLNQLVPASVGKELTASVTNAGQNSALNNASSSPAAGLNSASLNAAARNTAALSTEANAVNTLTTAAVQKPATSIPKEVATILQKWQQQLPTAADLSQPNGLSQAIKNSGIQYESQVFKTLEAMLTQQNNGPLNESAPAQLFKSLWQKAAQLTEAVKNPAALNSADNKSENLASAANSATANISQVLQAVKAKLEAPLTAASAEATAPSSTTATPSLLSALLGSDHKAVISRALITWSRLIQKMDSAPMPVRSLPMAPQQDVPETFRLLQTALAQTETEQAQRLNQADNWQLNIPLFYRDGDITREVRMHLSKEEQNANAEAGKKAVRWRLRLHFDLNQLGPLDVDLELQWPALSATFWSEQQQALGLLNKELQPLRNTLTAMGVMVEELQARHGKLPEPSRNVISSRLIDTHS